MDIDTLLEEIRTRLREAQEDTCTDPWTYTDEDLHLAIRSAIRHIKVLNVTMNFDLDLSGTFDTDPTLVQGMLVALKVCADLLRGDLTRKLQRGELGVSVKSVLDSYSTTEASKSFRATAETHQAQFDALLTIVLADNADTSSGVFGQQGTSFATE